MKLANWDGIFCYRRHIFSLHSDARTDVGHFLVFVMTSHPVGQIVAGTGLVTAFGRDVEIVVRAKKRVSSARIG